MAARISRLDEKLRGCIAWLTLRTEYYRLQAKIDRAISAAAAGDCCSDRYTDHMIRQVTATEAKARILGLLDDAAAGEEIEITKHGRTVARLVPAAGARSVKGSLAGVAMTAAAEEQLFSTESAWNAT